MKNAFIKCEDFFKQDNFDFVNKKRIAYNIAFNYPCYKKVCIDKNPKRGVSDITKLQKATKI